MTISDSDDSSEEGDAGKWDGQERVAHSDEPCRPHLSEEGRFELGHV